MTEENRQQEQLDRDAQKIEQQVATGEGEQGPNEADEEVKPVSSESHSNVPS